MKIINQYCEWVQAPPKNALQIIEAAGRTCYKSESKISKESAQEFARMILTRGHESVIEHVSASMRFITDRGVTHEMVRHRLASYSQESTRYCNYGKAGEITVIRPVFWHPGNEAWDVWVASMTEAEDKYMKLLFISASPQEARTVLPNSLKTEIVMTANLREWRHFFKLRCAAAAHPQMRDLALQAQKMFHSCLHVLFPL